MVLYVNACVRKASRTDEIAKCLFQKLGEDCEEVKLSELGLEPLSEERLRKRTELIEKGAFSDAMFALARQFKTADIIVMAAICYENIVANFCLFMQFFEVLAD